MSTETTAWGIPTETARKVAEDERARIVAWLREQGEQYRLADGYSTREWRDAVLWAAGDIEQGKEPRRLRRDDD